MATICSVSYYCCCNFLKFVSSCYPNNNNSSGFYFCNTIYAVPAGKVAEIEFNSAYICISGLCYSESTRTSNRITVTDSTGTICTTNVIPFCRYKEFYCDIFYISNLGGTYGQKVPVPTGHHLLMHGKEGCTFMYTSCSNYAWNCNNRFRARCYCDFPTYKDTCFVGHHTPLNITNSSEQIYTYEMAHFGNCCDTCFACFAIRPRKIKLNAGQCLMHLMQTNCHSMESSQKHMANIDLTIYLEDV